jgi:hypothetical protein
MAPCGVATAPVVRFVSVQMADHAELDSVEAPPFLPLGSEKFFLACRECGVIQSQLQFQTAGCPSCQQGPIARDELTDACTAEYHGFVGLIDAKSSWVARVINCQNKPSGIYAAHLPDEDIGEDVDDGELGDDDVRSVAESDLQGAGQGAEVVEEVDDADARFEALLGSATKPLR